MKKILFILFGAPGSGKGYLGECLKQEILAQNVATESGICYISTGDLLRAEMDAQTPLGLEIAEIINAGRYVSDNIVDTLVSQALQKSKDVAFLDGYPRTQAQLLHLKNILMDMDISVIPVKRDTPVSLILERVSQRRVCRNCKTTHSVQDGKCPKCGGESIVRKDDALIEHRLNEYRENTENLWPDLQEISLNWWWVDGTADASMMAQKIVASLL